MMSTPEVMFPLAARRADSPTRRIAEMVVRRRRARAIAGLRADGYTRWVSGRALAKTPSFNNPHDAEWAAPWTWEIRCKPRRGATPGVSAFSRSSSGGPRDVRTPKPTIDDRFDAYVKFFEKADAGELPDELVDERLGGVRVPTGAARANWRLPEAHERYVSGIAFNIMRNRRRHERLEAPAPDADATLLGIDAAAGASTRVLTLVELAADALARELGRPWTEIELPALHDAVANPQRLAPEAEWRAALVTHVDTYGLSFRTGPHRMSKIEGVFDIRSRRGRERIGTTCPGLADYFFTARQIAALGVLLGMVAEPPTGDNVEAAFKSEVRLISSTIQRWGASTMVWSDAHGGSFSRPVIRGFPGADRVVT